MAYTAAQRAKLPKKAFAGPKINGKPSFPLTNKKHDKAAIMDVAGAVRAGHLTPEEGAMIKAEARRKLKD